jgi:hypothetical protein
MEKPERNPVSGSTRVAWCRIIHDVLPMNERLDRMNIRPTETCRHCDKKDTLAHRLIDCGEGQSIWVWTKKQIAQMLRTVPDRIPDEWLTRPQFTLWPPKRRRAVLWTLANLFFFCSEKQRDLTLQDFMDFMQRTRWKLSRSKGGNESVENYLTVIAMGLH